MHIRTRDQLINWLMNNAPYRSIARAMEEGQVENLGAFESVVSDFQPGWIVKVTSKFNKIWYVKIQSMLHTYGTILIIPVPWELWIGYKSKNRLYRGDNPDEYKSLRDKELRNAG